MTKRDAHKSFSPHIYLLFHIYIRGHACWTTAGICQGLTRENPFSLLIAATSLNRQIAHFSVQRERIIFPLIPPFMFLIFLLPFFDRQTEDYFAISFAAVIGNRLTKTSELYCSSRYTIGAMQLFANGKLHSTDGRLKYGTCDISTTEWEIICERGMTGSSISTNLNFYRA